MERDFWDRTIVVLLQHRKSFFFDESTTCESDFLGIIAGGGARKRHYAERKIFYEHWWWGKQKVLRGELGGGWCIACRENDCSPLGTPETLIHAAAERRRTTDEPRSWRWGFGAGDGLVWRDCLRLSRFARLRPPFLAIGVERLVLLFFWQNEGWTRIDWQGV